MLNTLYHYKTKMIILIIFFIGIFSLAFFISGDIYSVIKDPAILKEWISGFGVYNILIFILIQTLQVIVFIIPGEVVEIAGGYLYNTVFGSLYSIIGILIGSAISFVLARFLGYEFVYKIVSKQMFNKLSYFINEDKRNETVIFLLYFIPGTPKDALAYFAGLTPISIIRFLYISMLARLPAIVFSAYIGANIGNRNYKTALIISVIASLIFSLGFIYRKKIINYLFNI